MKARNLEISVVSDLHLGSHACKAKSFLKYLKSIHPETLVLNGDIIDSWRFNKSFFPKSHLKVFRYLIKMMEKGIKIVYISGNHDEFIRRFNKAELGNLKICNQIVLELNGSKTWIFHGDIFDHIIHRAKWLARFASAIYEFMTMINKLANPVKRFSEGKELLIFLKIKKLLTSDQTGYSRFEKAAGMAAIKRNCQTVICGHTHAPVDKTITTESGCVRYINCGDWVKHLTALEYHGGEWVLYHFTEPEEEPAADDSDIPGKKELYNSLYNELAVF
ncbi:MAG: UDP-2,3-diacylglucosamine diphosphatase [Bacteroidales bacterium]|nr:UDP-2,3-diacylglucosamine diphosphatase [Bacteroidales bacterium]